MPERLTEAAVKALKYEGKPAIVRDAKGTGLLVAVNKTGKSYKVQRDLWQGQRGRKVLVKTVRHTLGGTEEMTLDDARSRATAVLDLIKRGIDPNAPPPDPSADAGAWTVRRMYEEYCADLRARAWGAPRPDGLAVIHHRQHHLGGGPAEGGRLAAPAGALVQGLHRHRHRPHKAPPADPP